MNIYPKQGDPLTPHVRDSDTKIYGVVIGLVTDNVHPEGQYMVRVRFPWLPGTDQSWWARISNFMSGKERGAFWLPEVFRHTPILTIGRSSVKGSLNWCYEHYQRRIRMKQRCKDAWVPTCRNTSERGMP